MRPEDLMSDDDLWQFATDAILREINADEQTNGAYPSHKEPSNV
jgi:hypothetical protein